MNREAEFWRTVWAYYRVNGRHDLPWRQVESDGGIDPYHIVVSEVMLQQTQVGRVVGKYREFLGRFPTFAALAAAPLADVLRLWSGLGYNRRARFLWECARMVAEQYQGRLPSTTTELVKLPGIGPNTAGAVVAYAFNKPVVFIETNIRTVFIHHFFADQADIADRQILDKVAATLPEAPPREWYWALMDYGTHLKQTVGNLNVLSKHYVKQSKFEGSRRQIRGRILRLVGEKPQTFASLRSMISDERLPDVLRDLSREALIMKITGRYHLKA